VSSSVRSCGIVAGVVSRLNDVALVLLIVVNADLRRVVGANRRTLDLPEKFLGVGFWIGLSYLLGVYFRMFANFNKTYGTLGAGIALMVWLYWTGFAMLVGAELNAELAKQTKQGAVEQKKEDPFTILKISA